MTVQDAAGVPGALSKIALIDPASARFAELSHDASIKQVTGMRNKRA